LAVLACETGSCHNPLTDRPHSRPARLNCLASAFGRSPMASRLTPSFHPVDSLRSPFGLLSAVYLPSAICLRPSPLRSGSAALRFPPVGCVALRVMQAGSVLESGEPRTKNQEPRTSDLCGYPNSCGGPVCGRTGYCEAAKRTPNYERRTSVPFRVFRVFRGCPALSRERSRGRLHGARGNTRLLNADF
jgi:hypothetical protein